MPHKDPEAHRAYHQAYRKAHSKELILANARLRKAKLEQYRLAERQRYAANREEIRAYQQAYYSKNKEKMSAQARKRYQENGERIRAYNRVWMKAHPIVRIRGKMRRRLRESTSYIEDVCLDVLYERDKGLCSLCHKKVTLKAASIDHIIPLALGGEHSYRNTALAHISCNKSKRDRIATQQMRLF